MDAKPAFSAELEDLLRDGGDEAVTLVLHEAIKRCDLPMIARISKMLNERQSYLELPVTDRIQGLDCPHCEDDEPHRHAPSAEGE
jgi:hypothetical protein